MKREGSKDRPSHSTGPERNTERRRQKVEKEKFVNRYVNLPLWDVIMLLSFCVSACLSDSLNASYCNKPATSLHKGCSVRRNILRDSPKDLLNARSED
jgi:hypothetical protein